MPNFVRPQATNLNTLMRRHIPNFITLLNLLTGIAGIWCVLESNPFAAAGLVLLAAVFDFSDGLTARLLNAYSPVGKSLDSLADMVSFGILPSLMVFKLQSVVLGAGADFQWGDNFSVTEKILLALPFTIAAFSAIRLARFDHDDRQLTEFRGLPTPANALFIASWLGSYPALHLTSAWIYNPWLIMAVSLLFSILMISDIKMFSLKFTSFKIRENLIKYIFLLVSVVLILTLGITGFLPVILLYILISFLMIPFQRET
jgi:CDP-diacylglycerol--serine O-phosphatidyltransferase